MYSTNLPIGVSADQLGQMSHTFMFKTQSTRGTAVLSETVA